MSISVTFLWMLMYYLRPSKAIECYQCTSLPNNDFYQEDCYSSTVPSHLAQTCKNISLNNTGLPIEEYGFLQMNNIFEGFLPQMIQNYTYEASSPRGGGSLIEFGCAKGTAVINKTSYVVRGCVLSISNDMYDKCVNIDNQYEFGTWLITKGKVCFCNENRCNSADLLNLHMGILLMAAFFILSRIICTIKIEY